MDEYKSLSRPKWECNYQVAFISEMPPENIVCRSSQAFGRVLQKAGRAKASRIEEAYLLAGHVHMMLSISPKYAVSQVVEFMKARARSICRKCRENGNRRPLENAQAPGHLCVDSRRD